MASGQEKVAASQPETITQTTAQDAARAKGRRTPEERRVRDALEDDEVREALDCLHARDKSR